MVEIITKTIEPEVQRDLVVQKENAPGFQKLRERYKKDQALCYLEEFIMRDKSNVAIPNVMNVTTNDPATYADRCVAILGTGKVRYDVTGDGLAAQESTAIEKYFRQAFINNDEKNSWSYIESLKFCINWYNCIRGTSITRTLLINDGGDMLLEVMPTDPWQSCWQVDRDGLVWGSYRLSYSKEDIYQIFGKITQRPEIPVLEIWTRNQWIVWGEGFPKPLTVFPHNFGEVPLSIIPVQTKPLTNDGTGISTQGESIYRANRNIYPKQNDLVSVWATSHKEEIMGPKIFESPTGRKLQHRPYGIGIVINLRKGEKLLEVPVKQIQQSGQALFGQYSAWLQRGGLSNVEYGEASFDFSAVALAKLGESKDQIFIPRLENIALQYKSIIRHAKNQYAMGGFKEHLTRREKDLVIPIERSVMQKKWFVGITFHTVYPEQNIAQISVAQAATEFLSDETILTEFLRLEDVPAEMAKKSLETAHKEIQVLRHMDFALGIAPIKSLSKEEIQSLRAAAIWWQIEQETGGAIKAPGQLALPAPKGKASQPRAGLQMPGMPQLAASQSPALHASKVEAKRQGIRQSEKGREAKENEQ